MNVENLREDAADPAVHIAARQLLVIERQFGIVRGVERGMEAIVVRGPGTATPEMDLAFGLWACDLAGLNSSAVVARPTYRLSGGGANTKVTLVAPTDPTAWEVPPTTFAPATFDAVRAVLLPDERFGQRSEDDYACFDPTPIGTQGIVARDAALQALLETLGGVVQLATVVDDRAIDKMSTGVFVLVSARAVLVLARVGWRG